MLEVALAQLIHMYMRSMNVAWDGLMVVVPWLRLESFQLESCQL